MVRGNLLSILLVSFLIISCSINDEGQRCALDSFTCGDGGSETLSAGGFYCTATPETSVVEVDTRFNVTITAAGGMEPYVLPTRSGGKRFSTSVTISGGYVTTGQKSEYITLYDAEGAQTSCLLNVTVE